MPQVQQLQPDPGVAALLQAGEQFGQAIERKQQLQLRSMIAATNSKNAETEQEKLKFQRKKQLIDDITKMADKGLLDKGGLKALEQAYGGQALFEELQELGAAATERSAQVRATQEAELGQKQAMAGMLEQALGTAQPTAPTAPGQDIPTDARAQAVSGAIQPGRFEVTGISAGQPTLTNIEAKARQRFQETLAGERAKFEAEIAPVRQVSDAYIDQLDRAFGELGGEVTGTLAARFRGESAKLFSEFGNLPEVQAAKREKDATALAVASFVNRGRPTEPDFKAALKTQPDLSYPKATNDALKRFNNKLLSVPLSNNPEVDNIRLLQMQRTADRTIVEADLKFMREALADGIPMEQIEQALRQFHAEEGL
jgi:hypothetical protein